ncbi:transcriptional regulator [Paenibacillus sp. BIHB 4019]|uniref:Transcriptional regulator n=1 Tax=Paenibacillus sp. BIHB 4019 TaxID=1870819 RepID=A0A1B2DJ97_9BACL|nr:LuxR C-terminal-related transcriptional regulator [Paenibacillus sp. BIHB 4019]ANY67761.1 transcriptional regulator [Paenibacillus sp. BIHB 4019]
MITPILATKLYIPVPRSNAVLRPRLIERLNAGLHRKLTVISASAGFGKTTLASEWVRSCGRPACWLSLDEGDDDPLAFMLYLHAALMTVAPNYGVGLLKLLQAPQPLPIETLVKALLSEIASITHPFLVVLDDFHKLENKSIYQAITLLLEHLPPPMHLVIVTRELHHLPMARLRVRDQLTEVRAADLRFTLPEASEFFEQAMGLSLTTEQMAMLEKRTEGWVAGMQLAGLSMQGQTDTSGFTGSFTGSHPFVLDYLVEEVLQQQPAAIQHFLLGTSMLDRFCGPLCDAVLRPENGERGSFFETNPEADSQANGQTTLEYLERANLFIVPLDNERRWYRYHHLFGDLLRQRLAQEQQSSSSVGAASEGVNESHRRASKWYELNGFVLEAFHHAATAQDIEGAARLLEGDGVSLIFRGMVTPALKWLDSLPEKEFAARPSLFVLYASALLMTGQLSGVEQKLLAAEQLLQADARQDAKTRDWIGHTASIRATLAVSKHQPDMILAHSRRALDYLHPDNHPVRTATTWTLGYAYQLQGEYGAAGRAYAEALASSKRIGHVIISFMAAIGLASIQEAENLLDTAAGTYRHALELAGEPPLPAAGVAYLGLARIYYQWNELNTAEQYAQIALPLTQQLEHTDRAIEVEVFLVRLLLARGDVGGAAALLAKAEHAARQHQHFLQMPAIAEAQVLVLLRQGSTEAAARLAAKNKLAISEAKCELAQGNPAAALAILKLWREHAEAKELPYERLKASAAQAVAWYEHGDKAKATAMLTEALVLAEPGGFVRVFVDEGLPILKLLREVVVRGTGSSYRSQVLAACEAEANIGKLSQAIPSGQEGKESKERLKHASEPLIEPLTGRELEVLQLIEQGLSNRQISERLFLALSSVKGHNRNIFDKLQVKRRTEAVARARELGLF